jgi:small subunit ribosomal protein S16
LLTIRLARTGKKKQAYFRLVVSDKRKAPTAKFVAILGNYDPHAKKLTIDREKLAEYLKNGVQPSESVAKILKAEKIELPKWVKITEKKKAPKHEPEVKEEAPKTEEAPAEESNSESAPEGEAPAGDENKAEEVGESVEATDAAPEEA